MDFSNDKKTTLTKKDKSRKGSIDKDIKALCERVNTLDDYYTTSSCSGRVVLLGYFKSKKKNETEFVYVTHEWADEATLLAALHSSVHPEIWFRQEGFILHVACRTMEHAKKMLTAAQDIGLKHSGLLSFGPKITLEIVNSSRFDAPLLRDGKPLTDDGYVKELITTANSMMEKNRATIERFEKAIEKI